MKKGVILISILIMILFFVKIISAGYNCSDNSSLLWDQDEIEINERISINGLGLGLINSDETPAINRYFAELIVDAYKFTLTNDTPSVEIELKEGDKTIELINLTGNDVEIRADGDSEIIEEGDNEKAGGLVVLIVSVEGEYPGIATVKGIVGDSKITLDNNAPAKTTTIDNTEYLLNLFSASNTNAIIKVEKCENKSAKIIEIEDAVNETTIGNETIITDNVSERSENESSKVIETGKENAKKGKIYYIIFVGVGVAIMGVLLVLIILLIKNLSGKKEDSQQRNEISQLP